MSNFVADIQIPDSSLAKAAAEILREYGNDLLWNHSHRVYLFGALMGKRDKVKYDSELLYISALFHDLGLTKHYSSPDKRFEVDGANAARNFYEVMEYRKNLHGSYGMPSPCIQPLEWPSIKNRKSL